MESLDEYLARLSSEEPVPGGGSAAMVVGAAACALVAMVARICAARPKYEAVHSLAHALYEEADGLRSRMLQLRERDEAAYAAVVAVRGNALAVQQALEEAAGVPLEGATAALSALRLAFQATELQNANLMSDVGCAAEFARAALAACAYNVRVNHKFMKNANLAGTQRAELERLERQAEPLQLGVRTAVSAALGPSAAKS